MEILEAIVHRVDKKRQDLAAVTLRKSNLPVDDVLKNTVTRTREAYNGNPSRGYGVFQESQLLYPFSALLSDYFNGKLTMLAFSTDAMKLLEKQMNAESLSTGGYVVFVSYIEAGKPFFMVVLLKLKGGVGIDEVKLALSANWNLDIDHLHEAARINVNNWKAKSGSYISFARKGSGNKNFATYFREFIGCTDFIESKVHTTELVKAINKYCSETQTPEAARVLKAKAFDYFEEKAKEGKPVTLAGLSMRFDDQNPKAFTDFLSANEVEISDGFEADKGSYRHLKRIGGKDTELSISFDRALLGKRVKYNKKDKILTIIGLPPSLVEELDKEN